MLDVWMGKWEILGWKKKKEGKRNVEAKPKCKHRQTERKIAEQPDKSGQIVNKFRYKCFVHFHAQTRTQCLRAERSKRFAEEIF